MTILEAKDAFFNTWFSGSSWSAWWVFLKALFALEMTTDERAVYTAHTGRTDVPEIPFREGWVVGSRRIGKTMVIAMTGTFLAAFKSYSDVLLPGQQGVVQIVASDRRQAAVCFGYVCAFFDHIPILSDLVESRTKDTLTLTNGVAIEVTTCSYKGIRGRTAICIIADEIAFWRSDSEYGANPDRVVLEAARPALASVPGSLLLVISSAYSRRGALWTTFSRYYGQPHPRILVWRGTHTMNPTIDPEIIEAALEEDESAARAEWFAEFRSDLESYADRELIESLVVQGRRSLPFTPAVKTYRAFVDPSGGSGQDSMTLAIACLDKTGVIVLVLLLERRPPFNPLTVASEFAETLKQYRLTRVSGDRYAGDWPTEAFRKCGIAYIPSSLSKSEIYVNALPLLNAGRVELLDSPPLIGQIAGLERRTGRGTGRDIIDHVRGAHDDVCNAALGAILGARPRGRRRRRAW